MTVYRISKTEERGHDLSGTGAFKAGGRWNNVGVFALYTSENQALAMLEILVHVEESELPANLYIATIEIDDNAPVYNLPDSELPPDWRIPDNIQLKNTGDKILNEKKYLAFKAKSAVIPEEFNFILNPLHPDYSRYVRIVKLSLVDVDKRL